MRIIAGTLHGHRLRCRPGGQLRPTGERMRESLFSALGGTASGAIVLDLFSGSGALGFEALSRGAEHVTFVERDRKLAALLERTARDWDVEENCTVVCADVPGWLTGREAGEFDIVFADPPFDGSFGPRVFEWWVASAAAASVLVLELPAGSDDPGAIAGITPVKQASFGDSSYRIYQQG